MKTPSPVKGEGAERCLSGDSTLSTTLSQTQHLPCDNSPSIIVDKCSVRIVSEGPIDVPRRQSFAWETDALNYGKRLAAERGWPIEARRHG